MKKAPSPFVNPPLIGVPDDLFHRLLYYPSQPILSTRPSSPSFASNATPQLYPSYTQSTESVWSPKVASSASVPTPGPSDDGTEFLPFADAHRYRSDVGSNDSTVRDRPPSPSWTIRRRLTAPAPKRRESADDHAGSPGHWPGWPYSEFAVDEDVSRPTWLSAPGSKWEVIEHLASVTAASPVLPLG
ncbi:hypothetical protein M427DRAFT_30492 [Gonapodya prolifera JEL478]|uniref:Uncharacterized protein n=1 Tax=Gonapodya prolifera (strain JEL478) TaxID=1344416 RepID=A0A139ALP5_GONPJ|nr:hypothetical protein M427DRAFT_30492 [Gonapodya prolifera JEL478]|eukprot:KXS17355.1 hypothetical protein M427DRAFT_30492 [Gonapodya prolifera JEL478]